MTGSLAGMRAVVTGASRGIGRAIALAFADAGADAALVARGREGLDAVAREVEARGRRAIPLSCDVTDACAVAAMAVEALLRLDGVEILVNNAGASGAHKLIAHPDELWRAMIAANLTSTYLVTKAFLPAFVERRFGRIVNVASTAAKTGTRYTAAYTAAKHGVLGLTRAAAAELAASGVTVNAVCPGFADTPMTQSSIANIVARTGMGHDAARAALEATSPQHRLIDPSEVAAAVVFFAARASGGITGQAINVDGGAVLS